MFQLVEFYVNVINYCIFKFLNRLSKAIDKINPFMHLEKIPRIKKNFEKNNTSLTEIVNKTWLDEERGFNIMYSTAAITFLIFLVIYSIFIFTIYLIGFSSKITWNYIVSP